MTTPKVLISDSMSSLAAEVFRQRGIDVTVSPKMSPDELEAVIGDYDGLAVRSATKVTDELLAKAPNLKVIGRAGIGVDNIDVRRATAQGVVVMNTPFGNAVTTAEHAIAMMFAVARQIPQVSASTHAGKWEKSKFMGTEITGKTLGLIGCGNIGSIVASRALGLKMKVLAYDPFLTEERAVKLGVSKVELDDLLTRADFVTLHVPATKETRGIISASAINKMKKGAYLINCARGGLVDETALKAALDSGHLAGAALDVFEVEPAKENILFGTPNLVCTPHLGAATSEAQEKVAVQIAEQMADFLLDGAVTNALNAPSLTAEEARVLEPYLQLVKGLGAMVGQLTKDEITQIQVTYAGQARNLSHEPLTQTAVQAVLAPTLSSVNMVNAMEIANERGIQVATTKTELDGDFQTLVGLQITTKSYTRDVKGTLVNGREPRVVEMKGIPLESNFGEHMLYVANQDQPGLIAGLGAALADRGVNIASLHLGRQTQGGEAVCLLEVDSPLSDEMMETVLALPQVERAAYLRFEL